MSIIGRTKRGIVPFEIPNNSNIVKCNNCYLIYVNPMPIWTENDFSLLYSKEYFEKTPHSKAWLDIRANKNTKERFERIKKYLLANSRECLEIGSGIFALMCRFLLKQGWSVTAHEPSRELCESLKYLYPELYTINTEFGLLPENKKYALLYADSVFEHVHNPLEYIKKSADLLEKGGILYFVSPNEHSFSNFLFNFIGKFKSKDAHYLSPYSAPYHLIGFSRKSIEIIGEKAGLSLKGFIKRYDYTWYHVLNKYKTYLIGYPMAAFFYFIDFIGYGNNIEIIYYKN